MEEIVIVGAGKFAAEIARHVGELGAGGAPTYRVACHVVVDGPVHVPAELCLDAKDFKPGEAGAAVLALSDVAARRAFLAGLPSGSEEAFVNIVHPGSVVRPDQLTGFGNFVGPFCYVGTNAVLGSFNVLNYHSSIGNHSVIGSNNFFSPNFHSGNSVEVGDDNFFGLSCAVAPSVRVGDRCSFQAGLSLFESTQSGLSYFSPPRIKAVKLAAEEPLQ